LPLLFGIFSSTSPKPVITAWSAEELLTSYSAGDCDKEHLEKYLLDPLGLQVAALVLSFLFY
jgi:hypothetical protein